MQVKIGDQIFDSDKQPISIRFFRNEIPGIVRMVDSGGDILNVFPQGMQTTDIEKFVEPLVGGVGRGRGEPVLIPKSGPIEALPANMLPPIRPPRIG